VEHRRATTHDGNPNEPNNYGRNAVVDRPIVGTVSLT
jgi:hypothetical protein